MQTNKRTDICTSRVAFATENEISQKERQLFDENIFKQEIDMIASFCTLLKTEPSSLFIHLDTSECLDISRGYKCTYSVANWTPSQTRDKKMINLDITQNFLSIAK